MDKYQKLWIRIENVHFLKIEFGIALMGKIELLRNWTNLNLGFALISRSELHSFQN